MTTDLIYAQRQLDRAKHFCIERGARDCIDRAWDALERAIERAKEHEARIAALDSQADEMAQMLDAEQEITDDELATIFAE